jgi:hypothetical protein
MGRYFVIEFVQDSSQRKYSRQIAAGSRQKKKDRGKDSRQPAADSWQTTEGRLRISKYLVI